MERALDLTIAYVKERKAFGKRLIDFQNTQFKLAECKTEATIARVFVDPADRSASRGQARCRGRQTGLFAHWPLLFGRGRTMGAV
jgi:alkylation response protein AidB-like acyl-CoA dehydrogenase